MVKLKDITTQFSVANYSIDCNWRSLESQLNDYYESGLELDPEFQRKHCWSREEQISYCEYIMRNGMSGRDIFFNHTNWNIGGAGEGSFVLVDGKQRIEAVRSFMSGLFPVFDGYYISDFDHLRDMTCRFKFNINDIPTERGVLQWYIDLNDCGVSHTSREINKVRKMIRKIDNE